MSSGEGGYGSLQCGFPSLSCMIAMLSRQLISAPFAKAVCSLLSASELLWALTLFLHCHLGMRQLKASGNLGFIDIVQRPQPGSICFPWQVSTTPACLRGCCPCTQPVGPYKLHFCGGDALLSNSSRYTETVVDVGVRAVHPGVRPGKEGLTCS